MGSETKPTGHAFPAARRPWHNRVPVSCPGIPTMSLDWTCKHHADLTLKELYALLQLRTEVFVVEQKCPYQEVDGLDLVGDTHHLMAWRDGQLLAYLRLLDPVRHEGQVVIGRVVSSSAARCRRRSASGWTPRCTSRPRPTCRPTTAAMASSRSPRSTWKTTSRTSACAGPEARNAADGGGRKGNQACGLSTPGSWASSLALFSGARMKPCCSPSGPMITRLPLWSTV